MTGARRTVWLAVVEQGVEVVDERLYLARKGAADALVLAGTDPRQALRAAG